MDEVRSRELAEGEPLEVFRLVHVSSAADAGLLEDMASNAAKSRAPRGREIRQPAVHDGVSVFKSRAQAVARRRRIVERATGGFARTLTLAGVHAEAVQANFDKGVLEVRIPEPEQTKPRRVQIGLGGAVPKTIEAE